MRDRIIPRFLGALLVLAVVGGGGCGHFFPGNSIYVEVLTSGGGSGVVYANGSGVSIGCQVTLGIRTGNCVDSFQDAGLGGSFTLTATADPGSLFMGWQGCSSVASNDCTLNFGPGRDFDFRVSPQFDLVNASLNSVSGDQQSAPGGNTLPQPLVVEFVYANATPGPATALTWQVTGGGTVAQPTTMSDAATGQSQNSWTLGTSGAQSVTVSEAGGSSVMFTASILSGNPACGPGGTLHVGGVDVTSPETWTAAGSPHIVQGQLRFTVGARLTIDAGAVVCVEPGGYISLSEGLYAVGTPANPIRFTATDTAQGWQGILLGGPATTPFSEISNARFEYAFSAIVAATPIRIDSTIIRQSGNLAIIIQNSSTSNRIFHTTVDTTFGSNPAVLLNAPGTVFVGTIRGAGGTAALMINEDSVTVQDCEINGSGGIGVLVANFQGAVVSNCNITGNAGLAVSGSPVDARSNWWGSAAGPAIGGPNGVSSGVDASNPLSAPATPGFRPVWIRRGSMVRLSRSP